jgi:hypothetical protein
MKKAIDGSLGVAMGIGRCGGWGRGGAGPPRRKIPKKAIDSRDGNLVQLKRGNMVN